MKKALITFSIAAFAVLGAVQTEAANPSTNIVQSVNFQISGFSQGATNNPSINITTITVDKFKITTKDVIVLIGDAIPTTFSSKARLVYVDKHNSITNVQAYEIRDGSNTVDVTSFFAGSGRSDLVHGDVINHKTGITTGTTYSLYHFVVTNIPPAGFVANGFAVTAHASINQKGNILGVDAVNATISGKGTKPSGVPFVGNGSVTILGHTVEVK